MAECAKARTGVKAEELAPGDHALVKQHILMITINSQIFVILSN